MWKPGSSHPNGPVTTPGQRRPPPSLSPKNPTSAANATTLSASKTAISSSTQSSSAKKRLSGATMNMKFMKRKKEMLQNEEKRKAAAAAVAAASNGTYSPSPASRQHHPQDSTAMEVDDPVDRTADQQFNINNHPSHYGQVVTSVDMYGMQAALIGRRSFGGFNPAMERAYSESKASVENRATSDRPQQKISDEELLERYKEIAMQRDGGGDGRGVGNLDTKVKKRKRQGLR